MAKGTAYSYYCVKGNERLVCCDTKSVKTVKSKTDDSSVAAAALVAAVARLSR